MKPAPVPPQNFRQRALQRALNKAMDWLFLAVFGAVLVAAFAPLRERVRAIWDAPDTIEELSGWLDGIDVALIGLSTDVRRLKQPDAVFELALDNSGPVAGYCVTDQPCTIKLRLRRTVEGATCRIESEMTEFGYVNPISTTFVPVTRLSQRRGRNLGQGWDDLFYIFSTPPGLEPRADFMFKAYYTGCPGTLPGDPPLGYYSERDSYTIRAEDIAAP